MALSLMLFYFSLIFILKDMVIFIEWELFTLNSSGVYMTILLDWMSLIFMSFVLFISSLIIYYSKEYMLGDYNLNRFIMLVFMFVLSMMLLIISPNLISILLGWDGLGLVSYCLVIYYQNIKSFNAGMLTALTNRIGDVLLLLSISWMLNYGSWNYIFYLECMKNDNIMKLISGLVILAGMTKSAQIPFSSWLPAAMAAPTPVSSLVHSSTLVTAGVYLLIRFNFCFNENFVMILLLLSTLTMLMAGFGANFEFDLKKIIALSTLSQLGFMMSILCLGNYILSFFHLLTHALFKALLFMCAGNIIHNLKDTQDIRFMGGLINQMPLTCICFNIANLSLCGLPFLSGFYSKDLIMEFMMMNYVNFFIFIMMFISVGLTAFYSLRLCYFLGFMSFNFFGYHYMSEESKIMLKSMIMLTLMVIFMGSMLSWLIFPTPYMICLSIELKLLTLLMCMIGGWMGYTYSFFNINWVSVYLKFFNWSNFLGSMWFLPYMSTYSMIYYPLIFGNKYTKVIDNGWSEYFGGQNIFFIMKKNSMIFEIFQNNYLKIYLMMFVMWLFILAMMMMMI
uniref:NADH-ubiquinone oxidoreductase chain 5 n=1 Tax=Incoltorrida madagassica TaxID=442089 RepID=A0A343A3L5_9COLE|nr:NADH dehydrogenase subunit 5 [Incoltorrida madagassica]AOY39143.1 NADH dehydrogenase subunit 5 [Incoltorrida madagassica]